MSITALGIVWAVLLWFNDRALLCWLSPVLAGWILAIPISSWTSRRKAGQWARTHGFFLTPEEVSPPPILKRFHQILEATATQPWATAKDGLNWVLNDAHVRSVHLAMLPPKTGLNNPLTQHRLDGLRIKVHTVGADALLPGEKRELLCDAEMIERLSRERTGVARAVAAGLAGQ